MGYSFYHIYLFFRLHGVGIHNVISKNYHMSDITLISRKICDKMKYLMNMNIYILVTCNIPFGFFFSHMETSPLPVKDCEFKLWHLQPQNTVETLVVIVETLVVIALDM
jgi:hypothetical protein